jgi:hypothetical protein
VASPYGSFGCDWRARYAPGGTSVAQRFARNGDGLVVREKFVPRHQLVAAIQLDHHRAALQSQTATLA